MLFHLGGGNATGADESAVIRIPSVDYQCRPEHIRCTQCKLREGSSSMGCEILHFVQNDKGGLSMTVVFRPCPTAAACGLSTRRLGAGDLLQGSIRVIDQFEEAPFFPQRA